MNNLYPQNDYRNYLEHSSRSHKYISRKMGRNGKWIYTYPKDLKKSSGWSKWKVLSDTDNRLESIPTRGVTRSAGAKSSIQPEHLKARPGSTSGKDTAKGSGNSTAKNRPRGHQKLYEFEKKSGSKTWSAKKGTVNKGKKLNLKKRVGNTLNRPFK